MSAPAAVHVAESTHFYTRRGEPAYEQVAKAGHQRPTTLADARKLGLVPSVTTILKCAAAPALEAWKVNQGILAALTLPRRPDEAEADWLARVKQDSQEQGRAAADRGTEIHAAIERAYAWKEVPRNGTAAAAVVDAVRERFEIWRWETELSFANPLGFGGKADLFTDEPDRSILLDIKTKDPWPESYPPKGFDEHLMQLAAYREGLGRPEATCANVFVSRQEPWQVHIHEWSEDELQRGWVMFRNLHRFWCAKNNYDPSWREDDDAIPF